MTKHFLTPQGQPYRVRGDVSEAFHWKDGWFPSVWNPTDGTHGNYFRSVTALRAWLVVQWRKWRKH